MTPLRVTLALVLVMVAVLLVVGCTGEPAAEKIQVTGESNTTQTIATLNYSAFTPKLVSTAPAGNQDYPLPLDKYVFVEHMVRTEGRAITGDCSPAIYFDGPTYSFDEQTGVLNTIQSVDNPVNVSLILFYASGESASNSARTGAVSYAYPVYQVPHMNYDNVSLHSVTSEGVVSLIYRNSTIVLKPKDRWKVNISRVIQTHSSGDNRHSCTEEIVTSDNFYNAGLFAKNLIRAKYFGNNGKFIDFDPNTKQIYKPTR